jgi:hypothetical protein
MKKTTLIIILLLCIILFGGIFTYNKFTKLKTQQDILINKQNHITEIITERKKQLFAQKLNRANEKLEKAKTSAIPFIGSSNVVKTTYEEIQEFCTDIKEFKEFEKSILGKADETISPEEKALCAYDYNQIESIVITNLDEIKNDSKNWAMEIIEELNSKLNKLKDE